MLAAHVSYMNRYEFSAQAVASLLAPPPPRGRKSRVSLPAGGGGWGPLAARIKRGPRPPRRGSRSRPS